MSSTRDNSRELAKKKEFAQIHSKSLKTNKQNND